MGAREQPICQSQIMVQSWVSLRSLNMYRHNSPEKNASVSGIDQKATSTTEVSTPTKRAAMPLKAYRKTTLGVGNVLCQHQFAVPVVTPDSGL